MNRFLRVITALNEANARYVVVGGIASIVHGVPRVTGDIDLIIDLSPPEAGRAIRALLAIGLRSPLPVDAAQFADAANRRAWIDDKGMTVFSLFDPLPGGPTVDLFVENPIPFEDLLARSAIVHLQGQPVRVCSVEDLIALKEQSSRPLDLEDVRTLRALQSARGAAPPEEDNVS